MGTPCSEIERELLEAKAMYRVIFQRIGEITMKGNDYPSFPPEYKVDLKRLNRELNEAKRILETREKAYKECLEK